MIYFSKNIAERFSKLFLIIFGLFLLISFSHSHNFDISFGNVLEIVNNQSEESSADHFLDSSFNCVIHAFNEQLKIDTSFCYNFSIKNISEDLFIEKYTFKHFPNYFNSNNLRAPPLFC